MTYCFNIDNMWFHFCGLLAILRQQIKCIHTDSFTCYLDHKPKGPVSTIYELKILKKGEPDTNKEIDIIIIRKRSVQENCSRRINPAESGIVLRLLKTEQNEWGGRKSDENMKRIHVIYVKVKRNVGDRVSTAAVRKYNLHSQVAELLSAADVRNHIHSLLFNHTLVLYRAGLFIAFFPLWTNSFNISVVGFYSCARSSNCFA